MSSDEEDISDYEISVILKKTIMRKPRTIRARPNHFNILGDAEFYDRFRLSKRSANSILELIGPHIKNPTNWNFSVSDELMFLITLRTYATGGMLKTIGDVYGVSASTVSKVVANVTHYIALLRSRFIVFPKDHEELLKNKQIFYDIAKFPHVVAALDCTHVRIISPGGVDAELYRNRKGFFSINVQTMCDAQLKILDIVARWPGSSHDSNILQNSKIYSRFCNKEFSDSLIVADSGYPNKSFIMTPLSNVQNPEENLYNESQIRTRNCIERSYGVWKRRFPILSLGIRLKLPKVEAIIVSTAVLHNICCINKETEVPSLTEDMESAINIVNSVPSNVIGSNSNTNNSTRCNLINNYFKNLL